MDEVSVLFQGTAFSQTMQHKNYGIKIYKLRNEISYIQCYLNRMFYHVRDQTISPLKCILTDFIQKIHP